MSVSDYERSLFGPLGPIPPEVLNGPASSGRKWKELTQTAKACMRIRNPEAREQQARRIEKAYHDLIEECRNGK